MLNTRNHTLIRNGLRNEGRLFAQYLVRVGGGVAILAAAVFAVGSLQFGALHEALVRMGPPAGLQVGTGQFGDMPMTSIEAGLANASAVERAEKPEQLARK